MQEVLNWLGHVQVGEPLTVGNLTLFPLLGPGVSEPGYLTLEEALGQHVVSIDEVSESGSVPELRLVNSGAFPVLLVDGEELVGAKQNRILNLTILVAGKATTLIPVSCVEAGRWSRRSATFSTAGRAHYAAGRAKKMEHVNRSLQERGSRHSDQSAVWADISAKSARPGAMSETGAMADMYEQRAASIQEYVTGLPPADGQMGAAFAIDGQLVGFDVFDCARTFGQRSAKLVRSFALDAIDRRAAAPTSPPPVSDVRGFLLEVAGAPAGRFAATGLGENLRVDGEGFVGAALLLDDRVVHLSAFRR